MPVSQAKRIAIEAYRLRNLDKHRQWSLNCYYRKRALLPEEERRGPGRPKKAHPAEPVYSYSELIRHDGSSFCRCCFKTIEDERWAEGVLE